MLVPQAVKTNVGEFPRQGLADTGNRSEDNCERLAGLPNELVVALGREGKQHALFDPNTHPHTVAMATKAQTDEGRAAYRRRKWIAESSDGWI